MSEPRAGPMMWSLHAWTRNQRMLNLHRRFLIRSCMVSPTLSVFEKRRQLPRHGAIHGGVLTSVRLPTAGEGAPARHQHLQKVRRNRAKKATSPSAARAVPSSRVLGRIRRLQPYP
jgi:hypothetical protein